VIVLVRFLCRKRPSSKSTNLPGVVYLNVYPGWRFSPNASPFCLRVEAYLRLANIPYEIIPHLKTSSKGKMPWITVDGQDIPDSEFILNALEKKFPSPDADLSAEQKALSHVIEKMVTENLYWVRIGRVISKCAL